MSSGNHTFSAVPDGDHQHSSIVSPIATTLLVSLTAIILFTRLRSTHISSTSARAINSSAHEVSRVPYWIPLVGHVGWMIWDANTFLARLRERFGAAGIFALNFGGSTHNIIYRPGLAGALLGQKSTNADSEDVQRTIMSNVFGYPSDQQERYEAGIHELNACYKMLLTEPHLGDMVRKTTSAARQNLLNFVTRSRSMVDQVAWERTSSVDLTEDGNGEQVVEASLLPLIRDFCAHTANASVMGSNFMDNFPDYFDDMWTLDQGFLLLSTGMPRWVPILSLTRAHIARRKMLKKLTAFHEALERDFKGEDSGKDWQDLDDVSPLVKARTELFRKYNFTMLARASCDLALTWAANANSNTLVFWMVNRIYADPQLLANIREEIEPYIKAVRPKQELRVPEAPSFERFDVEGVCGNCALLKSCYVECLRLDTASWSLKIVQQDFALQSRDSDSAWLLKKGEYVHAAHDLHNTDPTYFDDPLSWRSGRHVNRSVNEAGQMQMSADLGSIRPYGGGTSMCKGRAFAFKECMSFVAGIVALWDIQAAGGGAWQLPRHKKATGVYSTADVTRVWIKQRQLPESSGLKTG